MKNIKRLFTIGFLSLLFISKVNAQSKPTEFLSIEKKIEFNGEEYELYWSSHPSNGYYRQEYLRENDKLPKYEKMLMVEAVKGDTQAIKVATLKIKDLENRKKNDPFVSYEKFVNGKEIILEFVLKFGKTFEWNIIRYKNEENESGNYLVLYSYRYRMYGSQYLPYENVKNEFLNTVKTSKTYLVKKVREMELSNVKTK